MTTILKSVFLFSLPVLAAKGLQAEELVTLSGRTMGTSYSIKLANLPDGLTQKALKAEIDETLEELNRQMSTWREDSEISRFNRFDKTEWFPVSQETAAVVETALNVSRQTNGAFDITVGPLVNLWNFGPDRKGQKLPSDADIAEQKKRVGYGLLEVRTSSPALRKTVPGLYIDLSAIAKGFGVDQVAGVLESRKIASYMVEIGGEIRTAGTKPDGSKWRVGIEKPVRTSRSLQTTLDSNGGALATSGDYRNFVVVDGKYYSHTIDPRTGRPVEHALASVSVVSEVCMLADAYATALMVMGPDAGYEWAKEQDLAALFLIRSGETFVEKPTPAFERLFPRGRESSLLKTWLIAAGIFLLAIALMSVGVILSNRRITGSCGGLAGLKDSTGKTLCDACTNPAPDCQGPQSVSEGSTESSETSGSS